MGSETPLTDAVVAPFIGRDDIPPNEANALLDHARLLEQRLRKVSCSWLASEGRERELRAELTAANLALQEVREKVKEECAGVCDERADIHGAWKDRADTELARNAHTTRRFEAIRIATAIRSLP